MNEIFQQNQPADVLEDIVKPPIYSKRAIWGFSFFFTPVFGGILLMQNLKSIGKRKEGNTVLIISILVTVAIITALTVFDIQSRFFTFLCNFSGAALLTEFFSKKYIPNDEDYDKKPIWKPLIIGILICIALIAIAYWGQDQVAY